MASEAADATESATKKRKAEEMETDEPTLSKCVEEEKRNDEEDAMTCNICFEAWSNTGTHRISSLKCGHFFGLSCIEKWLNSTGGNDCPTCNEKAAKKDIRHHYVATLKAIDTGERDRALEQVESLKKELRALELEMATLKVTNHLQKEEIEKLKILLKNGPALLKPEPGSSSQNDGSRLNYVKRLEIMKPDLNDVNRFCRVMCYNQTYGMLVLSQPSFTALAPGYGVRRVHMLDKKLESFVSLHKEPIRDLAFNPLNQDQLLSASQDKTIRLTNINSCAEIQRFHCQSEVWSCCWNLDDPYVFYVGTKRSQILVYDTREPLGTKGQLDFPVQERRPIIGLIHVPKSEAHPTFPCSGLLVMTLGSLWFFEETFANGQLQHVAHKLAFEGLFWSFHFNNETRQLLVSTRPNPHARHVVLEMARVNLSEDVTRGPDFHIRTNIIFDNKHGGSYKERSFLRSTMCQREEGQLRVLFGRGSAQHDHRLVVQEVGNEKILQEIPIEKPILDICSLTLNSDQIVCILTENELHIYKWT